MWIIRLPDASDFVHSSLTRPEDMYAFEVTSKLIRSPLVPNTIAFALKVFALSGKMIPEYKPTEIEYMEKKPAFTTIDEYIATFPKDMQKIMKEIRATIKAAAPRATEKISYQMPTFYLNGNLVHFAAFKKHIGFYPAPRGIEAFKKELSAYKGAKGSVQFPLDKPIPLKLIAKIVKFRVTENLKKPKTK